MRIGVVVLFLIVSTIAQAECAWYPSPGAIREGPAWDGKSCEGNVWCQFVRDR